MTKTEILIELREIYSSAEWWEAMDEAETGKELRNLIERLEYDVILEDA